MIMTTYYDFRSLRWVICPVCPAQTRDITSSGWVRTGKAADGGGLPLAAYVVMCPITTFLCRGWPHHDMPVIVWARLSGLASHPPPAVLS